MGIADDHKTGKQRLDIMLNFFSRVDFESLDIIVERKTFTAPSELVYSSEKRKKILNKKEAAFGDSYYLNYLLHPGEQLIDGHQFAYRNHFHMDREEFESHVYYQVGLALEAICERCPNKVINLKLPGNENSEPVTEEKIKELKGSYTGQVSVISTS